jgi:class 3 adenylate cyclase
MAGTEPSSTPPGARRLGRVIRAFLEETPELRPATLRFRDAWLEQRYQDSYFDANLPYIRIAAILGAITWAAFGPLARLVVHDEGLVWDSVIRYGFGVPSALISFAMSYHPSYRRFWQQLFAGAILFSGAVWVAHRALVEDARNDWGYAGIMLIMIFAYLLSRLQFRYSAPVGIGLFVLHNVGSVAFVDERTIDLVFGDYFLLVTAFIGTIAAYFLERSQRLLFLRERDLDRERGRSEGLLRNVLPAQIAERLKEQDPATDHGHIAQAYDEVTVLFADLVGFTSQSGVTDPPDIVAVLDEVFRRFDGVVERYGLETIKTVGDAYMAVAGAPVSRPDDLECAADAALAMLEVVRELRWPSGDPMHVRIGMATGPAVAGVIGRRKFAYDLWGDTVNTAARMEANGVPDEIQVSEPVYRGLRDTFVFSDVHIVNLKGKGPTPARFLLGRNGTA